jgi:hypothetical protein
MAFLRPLCRDGGMVKPLTGADVLTTGFAPFPVANAAAQTLPAAAITAGVILRTLNASALTDTTDTSVNIMQGLYGNTGAAPEVGETFRVLYSNQAAGAITIAGGVGVTVSGNTIVATLTVKTLLFVCTNKGTQTYANGIYTNVGATFNCICL